MKFVKLCILLAPAMLAAQQDPAYAPLTKAFDALRTRNYDEAIANFEKAAVLSPQRADIHKNLAYALLKTGDTDTARDHFREAMRLDPADLPVALEYAFLCYEARDNAPARKAEARRIFDRIRAAPEPAARATAEQAFQNIDAPLKAGIARWQQVLATSPPTFSAYYELARLAEQRDELDLATASYLAAYHLLPERKSVLLDLARAETTRNHSEGARAALLAASRGNEPRAAELAREQLPDRYPYVYEFRQALELDPQNGELHRELAYLLLSMSETASAKTEFKRIIDSDPADYLATTQLGLLYLADDQTSLAMPLLRLALARGDSKTANRVRIALKMPLILEDRGGQSAQPQLNPGTLGERSYAAGFLKDAKRFFLQAHEQNSVDSSVILKLAWTSNMLHDDPAAVHWFALARRSSDPAIAAEADHAYKNLHPEVEQFRTTFWMYPLYSSRWNDLFGYGQLKTEIRQKHFPRLHFYASLRFVGDARRTTGGLLSQSLSESAFIPGVGVATDTWRGATAWFEAGGMFSYLSGARSQDYRGGISYTHTLGASLAAESSGRFFDSTDDIVFVSHFQNDVVNSSQNRAGYTTVLPAIRMQTFWSTNINFDFKRQYWATFIETGPGFRFRIPAMPPAMYVTLSALRGIYLINQDNPRRPNFNDFRTGVWYAFTK